MAGRPVGRPLPGSAELPRAARRALGRHRSRAGALPSGHFDHAGTPLLRLVPPLRVPSSCCGSILRLIIVHSCQGRSIDQYTAQLSGGSAGGVRSSSMQQSAGRTRRVCACAWWRSGRPEAEARQCGAAVLCMVAVSGGGCERSCDGWSAISGRQCATVSPGGDAAMEANKADTRRASGWRRAGRRGADRLPWRGRACSGWGPRHLVWVQKVLVVDAQP